MTNYLLGWDPGEKAFDLKHKVEYHSIRIKLRRPGLKVRSRAGFFGRPEGQPTHSSARLRMLSTLDSPFRGEDIAVDLTASFQKSDALGPYIESLLHVSPQHINFTRDERGCSVAHVELATVPEPLGADFEPSTFRGQLTTIEACGSTADTVLRDGLVFTARQKISAPGPYEMHVVVRDVPSGEGPALGPKHLITDSDPKILSSAMHLGSASEFVNIPDLRADRPALTGIKLSLESASELAAGASSWRPAVAGDPAIRDFHPGDIISYRASLLDRNRAGAPVTAEMNVLFEGKPIHSEVIQTSTGAFRGSYRIDPGASPGQYLLGIELPNAPRKGSAVTEWITFQLVR